MDTPEVTFPTDFPFNEPTGLQFGKGAQQAGPFRIGEAFSGNAAGPNVEAESDIDALRRRYNGIKSCHRQLERKFYRYQGAIYFGGPRSFDSVLVTPANGTAQTPDIVLKALNDALEPELAIERERLKKEADELIADAAKVFAALRS